MMINATEVDTLRARLMLVALVILLSFSTIPRGSAAPFPSSVALNISPGLSHVSYSLNIFQNLTTILPSFVLPQPNGVLQGTNATSAAAGLQAAISAKSPSAQLSGLKLEAVSTPWFSANQTQWLNMSLGFDIAENSRSNGQNMQFDATWRYFTDTSSIQLSGVELNTIGEAYLHPAAEAIAGLKGGKGITFTYHLNGAGVSLGTLTAASASTAVFNFSSLSVPLSQWASSFNYTSGSMTLSLKPLPRFTFEVQETVQEAQPEQVAYLVTYSFQQATFTTPYRSSVNGNTIIVTFGDLQETIMALIIASVLAISVGTYLAERRLLKKDGKRPKR